MITGEDELLIWGNGKDGKLGLGDSENQSTPTVLDIIDDNHHGDAKEIPIQISVGLDFSMVLTKSA